MSLVVSLMGTGAARTSDAGFVIQDNVDPTKQIKFQASSISAATTRTVTVPDADLTMVGSSSEAVPRSK